MFLYIVKIVIKAGKADEFEHTLRSISSNILQAEGCLGYGVYRDSAKKDTFVVVGEWKTRQAREKHFKSHDYEVLIGAARVLGNEFEMKIAEGTKSGSLELAREQTTSQ